MAVVHVSKAVNIDQKPRQPANYYLPVTTSSVLQKNNPAISVKVFTLTWKNYKIITHNIKHNTVLIRRKFSSDLYYDEQFWR